MRSARPDLFDRIIAEEKSHLITIPTEDVYLNGALYRVSPMETPFMSTLIPWAFPDRPGWPSRFHLFPRWDAFWKKVRR